MTELVDIVVDHTRLSAITAPYSQFTHRKDGYVAIVRDQRKRVYSLVLCKTNKEPILSLYVSAGDINKHAIKQDPLIFMMNSRRHGEITLNFCEAEDLKNFYDKFTACLADRGLTNESIIVETGAQVAVKVPISNYFDHRPKMLSSEEAMMKIVYEASLKTYEAETKGKSDQMETKPVKTELKVEAKENSSTSSDPAAPKTGPMGIKPKNFYSNSGSSSTATSSPSIKPRSISDKVLDDMLTFDSADDDSAGKQSNANHKRRREELDENKPEPQSQLALDYTSQNPRLEQIIRFTQSTTRFNKRNCITDYGDNKENSSTLSSFPYSSDLVNQYRRPETPRRDPYRHFDYDSQENNENMDPDRRLPWSITKKQSGKGFSNLGNTCYMNAILQCLVNIEVFANDLISNYNLFKTSKQLDGQCDQQNNSVLVNSVLKSNNTMNSPSRASFFTRTIDTASNKQTKPLLSCLCELLKARESHNENLLQQCLREIKKTISQEADRFSGYQQHDAHDFLCQVLDQLKEDVDKLIKGEQPPLPEMKKLSLLSFANITEAETEPSKNSELKKEPEEAPKQVEDVIEPKQELLVSSEEQQKQHNGAEKSSSPETPSDKEEKTEENSTAKNENVPDSVPSVRNPVVDNFEFEAVHAIQCKNCNHVITKREVYNNFCLEMPNSKSNKGKHEWDESAVKISLQDALNLYFRDEELNDFKCEKCSNTQVVIKKRLVKLPRVLICHLKRYQVQEVTTLIPSEKPSEDEQGATETKSTVSYSLVKNDSVVKIPRYLTLKSVVSSDSPVETPRKATPAPEMKNEEEKIEQDLAAKPDPASSKQGEGKQNQEKEAFSVLHFEMENAPESMVMSPCDKKFSQVINKPFKSHFGPATPEVLRPLRESNSRTGTPTASPRGAYAGSLRQTPKTRKSLTEKFMQEDLPELDLKGDNNENAPEQGMAFIDSQENQVTKAFEEISSPSVTKSRALRKGAGESFGSPRTRSMMPKFLDGIFDPSPEPVESRRGSQSIDSVSPPSSSNVEDIEEEEESYRLKRPTRTFSNKSGLNKEKPKNKIFKTKNLKKAKESEFEALTSEDHTTSEASNDSSQVVKKFNLKIEDHNSQEVGSAGSKLNELDDIEEPFFDASKKDNKAVVDIEPTCPEEEVTRDDPYSYRVVSIVNHLGSSPDSGHYISDVYNMKTKVWSSYDDTRVDTVEEDSVLKSRCKTGYIFFFIHNSFEPVEANM